MQKIWAHLYIDAAVEDAEAVLQRMGGARAILATGTSGGALGRLVLGLAARGKLIVVGAPDDPIQLTAAPLIFGGRSVYGCLTGTPIESEDALAFSVLQNIRPMIQTAPLEQAADAYTRMMQGKARFRMVLITKNGAVQSAEPADRRIMMSYTEETGEMQGGWDEPHNVAQGDDLRSSLRGRGRELGRDI